MDDEHTAILSMYPEIDVGDLMPQLQMFRRKRDVNSVTQAVAAMRNMLPEVQAEYPQVSNLLRLLLVSPASSATAERSFSALRRLKTWLRSTMTEVRLNAVSVCHVHQDKIDGIVNRDLMRQFVACNDFRRSMFGELE